MISNNIQAQPEKMDKTKYKIFFGAYIGWIFDYYEVFLLSFLVIPMAAALFTVDCTSCLGIFGSIGVFSNWWRCVWLSRRQGWS